MPETRRTAAGYRHNNDTALARLELVRGLRDLGIDLTTIQRIGERRTSIEDVARANVGALDLHIRQLSLRRAMCVWSDTGSSSASSIIGPALPNVMPAYEWFMAALNSGISQP